VAANREQGCSRQGDSLRLSGGGRRENVDDVDHRKKLGRAALLLPAVFKGGGNLERHARFVGGLEEPGSLFNWGEEGGGPITTDDKTATEWGQEMADAALFNRKKSAEDEVRRQGKKNPIGELEDKDNSLFKCQGAWRQRPRKKVTVWKREKG